MHWRRPTWALIAWTVLMVLWAVGSAVATSDSCSRSMPDWTCSGHVVFAVAVVLAVWLTGAVLLWIVWHGSRPRRRCPACGRLVPAGYRRCRCGSLLVP